MTDWQEWHLIDVFYSTKANYEKKDVLKIINNFIQKLVLIKNSKEYWTNDDIIKIIYDIFLYHEKRLSAYNLHYIKRLENNEYYESYNNDIQVFKIFKHFEMNIILLEHLLEYFPNENLNSFKWLVEHNNDPNCFVKLYTLYSNRIDKAITIQNDIKERIIQVKSFSMLLMWINRDHCSIICNAKYIKKLQQYQDKYFINPCIRCQSMELEMLFSDISNICTSYHCKKCQHHHKEINCPFNRVCRRCKKLGHYENKCRYK